MRPWNQDQAQAGRHMTVGVAARRAEIAKRNELVRAIRWMGAQYDRHPDWFSDDNPEGGEQ